MSRKIIIATLCACVVVSSGCSKFSKNNKPSGYHHASASQNQDIAYEGGVEDNTRFYGEDSASHQELLAKRTYRFAYDSYDVSDQDLSSLYAHADHLSKNPQEKIRVEGHTDERGSREYNVGLGERRAKAIANVFLSKGVSPSQFRIVSYGEEMPESYGSTEENYKLNRRAVVVYE